MSMWTSAAAWQARVSPSQKLVLLAVAECCGGDGEREWWRRDDAKVSRLTSLSMDRIDWAVHQLMRRGVLVEGFPPVDVDRSEEWYEVILSGLPGVDAAPPHLQAATEEDNRPAADRSGYVYVISGGGYCKIGKAKDPDARIKGLGTKLPFVLRRLLVVPANDYTVLERELHEHFADKRAEGEWFTLTPADVDWIAANYGASE